MTSLTESWRAVITRIQTASHAAHRLPGEVTLLAVSKTQPADHVRALAALGQHAFGENYVQEGVAKVLATADLGLEWHFIGPIQSNKTAEIARHFDWVHSVDREKVARRLNDGRNGLPPLQVLIQVNISKEASKSGVAPAEAETLAQVIRTLPNLRLRGLMAIPAATQDYGQQKAAFDALVQLQKALLAKGYALDTLSMGMSHDLEAAIAAGATLVRIGQAIFGERPSKG